MLQYMYEPIEQTSPEIQEYKILFKVTYNGGSEYTFCVKARSFLTILVLEGTNYKGQYYLGNSHSSDEPTVLTCDTVN